MAENAANLDSKLMMTLLVLGVLVGVGSILFIRKNVVSHLQNSIEVLQKSASQVSGSAAQVAASSQSLAEGATEQAASLQETAASLEEISSVSKHNTENSQEAFALSDSVRMASESGTQAMDEMLKAISRINTAADETAHIVKIIDDIAFQTNLLALNAAVEAARAGDAGRGFAVVADEVRNLAQRSANAAKETSTKIHQSKELAANGVKATEEVAKILVEIKDNALKSAELVKEIAISSKEQTTGVSQINVAVSELDKVTQQNSAAAEESSAASEELSGQASSLKEIVLSLTSLVYGKNHQNHEMKPTVQSGVPKKAGVSPVKRTHSLDRKNPVIKLDASKIIPLDDNDFAGF